MKQAKLVALHRRTTTKHIISEKQWCMFDRAALKSPCPQVTCMELQPQWWQPMEGTKTYQSLDQWAHSTSTVWGFHCASAVHENIHYSGQWYNMGRVCCLAFSLCAGLGSKERVAEVSLAFSQLYEKNLVCRIIEGLAYLPG